MTDLQSSPNSASASFRLGLPSPRVLHHDGEIPPSLSPLDAFAAHIRKLAMELEAVKSAGARRMSRLPPAYVSESLSEYQLDRLWYFRFVSEETQSGVTVQTEEKDPTCVRVYATERHTDSITSHPDLTLTPAPPQAGFSRATNHMRILKECSDDDYASSFGGSTFSQPRKLSSSSGVSTPQSPRSPFAIPHARSPSLNSELSAGGSRRSKSNLNFSRPLSSTSLNRMAADSPSQGQLFEAQMSKYLGVTDGPPPRSSVDESQPELSEGFLSESGPSYPFAGRT
jgi:hypothetical protein